MQKKEREEYRKEDFFTRQEVLVFLEEIKKDSSSKHNSANLDKLIRKVKGIVETKCPTMLEESLCSTSRTPPLMQLDYSNYSELRSSGSHSNNDDRNSSCLSRSYNSNGFSHHSETTPRVREVTTIGHQFTKKELLFNEEAQQQHQQQRRWSCDSEMEGCQQCTEHDRQRLDEECPKTGGACKNTSRCNISGRNRSQGHPHRQQGQIPTSAPPYEDPYVYEYPHYTLDSSCRKSRHLRDNRYENVNEGLPFQTHPSRQSPN